MTGTLTIWGLRHFALAPSIIERLKALDLWRMVCAILFRRDGLPCVEAAYLEEDDAVLRFGVTGAKVTVRLTESGTLTIKEEEQDV